MPQPDLFPIYDRLVDGGLEAYLCKARGKGESFHRISTRLRDEFEISVSVETIRRWCSLAGAEKPTTEVAG
jgi:intein-encoded DNA endonuclease-like protein